jgi:hypothetical protein
MNALPHDDQPDVAVATWLTEVGRRRVPLAPSAAAEATLPPRREPRVYPGHLFLFALLFLSGVQYVYVATMLAIVSLPGLVFFGIR